MRRKALAVRDIIAENKSLHTRKQKNLHSLRERAARAGRLRGKKRFRELARKKKMVGSLQNIKKSQKSPYDTCAKKSIKAL